MAEITKDSTIEEAMKSVGGTRTMLVMKFKPFLETGFGVEDLFAVADEAILIAWRDWEPEKSKFNTFAYNHMSWALNDLMNDMNSRFKVNAITTYELTREGQSFKEIKEAGKTANEDFNKSYNPEYALDGSDFAKARINRDTFNAYVQYETSIRRPIHMINESQFKSDGSEDFDIFDTADVGYDQNSFKWDDFSIPKDEMEQTMKTLDADKRKVAQMILDGHSVNEMAIEFGITKNQFMQKFAGESSGTVGKAKTKRANGRAELAAAARARRDAAKLEAEMA